MAELFLAKDTRNDRMVVLKRILPYLAEEAEFVRMFLDEARIAAALHHPSIVELYELGHLEGSTFIAMEWVDGIDLRRVLLKEQERQRVVPAGVAAWLVARLCEGLHHAHFARDATGGALGIIHRDVSPQNVMVSFRADVKLVDFGIAKATAWMDRSKPGVIKGKFLYLSPEQLTTEPLDHRMDLFALGTMLYELTTGQSPFYRTSTEAVIYAIRMEDPEPPSTHQDDYPKALEQIILKCLVKDRERRYQTAGEIRDALEDFMSSAMPTTREDAIEYISKLFGDANERTSIFIPPNAESKKAQVINEVPTDSHTDRSPASDADDERTKSVSPVTPEGRKPPREIDAEPTGPTRNDRPRVRAQAGPWDAEVTSPMSDPAVMKRLRDFQATADLDASGPVPSMALGEGEVQATMVSTSGARDIEVGEVFPPLLPTMMGESDPSLPPTKSPSFRAPRLPPAKPAHVKPAPPLPSSDSIPELSVVSAGEATMAALDSSREVSEPSQPPEPPLPAPSTRAPPRRGPPPAIRRPPPHRDPEDDVATVDQQHEFSVTTRSSSQKVLFGIFGMAALVVLVLLAVLFWPSSEPAPRSTPKPAVTPRPALPPAPRPAPGVPGKVRVQLRAMKGTVMVVDGQAVAPDGIIEVAPGELVVKFACPPKKRGAKPVQGTARAQVPDSTGVVAVEVSCR